MASVNGNQQPISRVVAVGGDKECWIHGAGNVIQKLLWEKLGKKSLEFAEKPLYPRNKNSNLRIPLEFQVNLGVY